MSCESGRKTHLSSGNYLNFLRKICFTNLSQKEYCIYFINKIRLLNDKTENPGSPGRLPGARSASADCPCSGHGIFWGGHTMLSPVPPQGKGCAAIRPDPFGWAGLDEDGAAWHNARSDSPARFYWCRVFATGNNFSIPWQALVSSWPKREEQAISSAIERHFRQQFKSPVKI
jgi:hypothetical protein